VRGQESKEQATREKVPKANKRNTQELFKASERREKLRLSSVLLFFPKIGF
jgi:hypothetical protein